MPISWLDVILIAIMLISGFLAMVRGFTREVLSIFSWAVAAVAALYLTPKYASIARALYPQSQHRPDRLRRRRLHPHPDRGEPDHLPHFRQSAGQPRRRARPHLGLHFRAGARVSVGRHRLHSVHARSPATNQTGSRKRAPTRSSSRPRSPSNRCCRMNPEQYLPGVARTTRRSSSLRASREATRRRQPEAPRRGAPAGPAVMRLSV